MNRSTLTWGAGLVTGLVLLSGCVSSSSDDPTVSTSASSDDPVGNGTLYVSDWDYDAGTETISAHPILPDGALGQASTLLSEPAADADFPGVVDGVGPTVVTGTFADYWTTAVQVHESSSVRNELAAPDWCGGEGLTYSVCSVLDDQRLARTSELGGEPESGAGPAEGSVLVSSLADGSTIDELGPFANLSMMLGTGSPDEVLLVNQPLDLEAEQGPPAEVVRLDITNGSTTPVGTSAPDWVALCAIGADSVLGFNSQDPQSAVVVGPATIADVTWPASDQVVGCSADGRYLYVQRSPLLPSEDADASEPANPATTVERITLADGTATKVLDLPAGQYAGPITR